MSNILVTKTCPVCGNTFVPRNNRHTYCKTSCRKSNNRTKHLGSGVTVRGNQVTVKGAVNVSLFALGL